MSLVPAAHFLIDFGIAEVAEQAPHQDAALAADLVWEERVEDAYARGVEQGKTAADAGIAALIEEQNAASEQGFAAARKSWCEEEGPRLAEQIRRAIAEMENRIAESAERVLKPFLAQAVRTEAIGRLRAIVQELIGTNPGMTLEVSGPEDLLDAVRSSLQHSAVTVSYVANDACDVQIKAGASIVETRIAAWLEHSGGKAA